MKRIVRAAFCALILIEASGTLGFIRHDSDFSWLGLIATIAFIWYLLEHFEAPDWLWPAALFMLVLDTLSATFLLYSKIGPWDRVMHTLGGATIAAGVLDQAVRALNKEYVHVRNRVRFTLGIVYLSVAAIGFCYELLEYLVDRLWFGYPKTLVSGYNTVEDQLFNLLGTSAVLGGYYLWQAYASRSKTRLSPRIAHASGRER
jgi:hypothetical protein